MKYHLRSDKFTTETLCGRVITPYIKLVAKPKLATCKQCLIRIGIRRDCDCCKRFYDEGWGYCANCGKRFK